MLKILPIFLITFVILYGQTSQDNYLDRISGLTDTQKVEHLNNRIWKLRSSNPDSAFIYGDIALELGLELNNKSLLASTHNFLGVVYRNIGHYETSLSNYITALNYAEEISDSIQIAYSYNNIGGIYRLQSNFNLALENIFKALRIFELLSFDPGIGFCTINIGVLYWQQGNYNKSLEYLNLSLAIREKLGDESATAVTLNNIAEVYYEQKDYDTALKYYLELESVYKKLDDLKGLASIWGGIGGTYYFKGDYRQALEYREMALEMDRQIGHVTGQIINLNNLGLIYARFSQYRKAERHLKMALDLAYSINVVSSIIDCYKFNKDYYEIRSDYRNAFIFLEKYKTLEDSLQNEINLSQVSEIESVYKIEKSERENKILLKDIELKEKQQYYLFIIAFLILLLAVFTFNRYSASKASNKKLRELNAMKDKFFRIMAHDLKNPLNTLLGYSEHLINSYDTFNDDERKEEISGIFSSSKKISTLIENLLDWARSQTGLFHTEISKIQINKVIMSNISLFEHNAKLKEITIKHHCSDSYIILSDKNIVNTILRNLISNAIKFTNSGGKIDITCKKERGYISVSVSDNGVGIPPEHIDHLFNIDRDFTMYGTENEKGTGLGLILIRELVEKSDGTISVESTLGKGSTFTFSLPMK